MKSILACVDFSDVSPAVVETAAEMAEAIGARLYLLHVAPVLVPVGDALVMPIRLTVSDLEALRGKLVDMAQGAIAQGVACEATVIEGPAVDVIVDEATRRSADLVVIGSHGHGALYHLLLGGTAQGVLRRAGRRVLVVPSSGVMGRAAVGAGSGASRAT